jgi:hypothetical protein
VRRREQEGTGNLLSSTWDGLYLLKEEAMYEIKIYVPKWLMKVNESLPSIISAFYSLRLMERKNRNGDPTFALGLFLNEEGNGFPVARLGYPGVIGNQRGDVKRILRGIRSGKVAEPETAGTEQTVKYLQECETWGYIPKPEQLPEEYQHLSPQDRQAYWWEHVLSQ